MVAADGGRVLPRTEDFSGSLASEQWGKDEKDWDPSLHHCLGHNQGK